MKRIDAVRIIKKKLLPSGRLFADEKMAVEALFPAPAGRYQGSIIHVYAGVLEASIPFTDGKDAEKIFWKLCKEHIPEFKEFSNKAKLTCLAEGYAERADGKGDIYIRWF